MLLRYSIASDQHKPGMAKPIKHIEVFIVNRLLVLINLYNSALARILPKLENKEHLFDWSNYYIYDTDKSFKYIETALDKELTIYNLEKTNGKII